MKQTLFALLLALTCCWPILTLGQEAMNTSAPIQIEADRMETSQEKNFVLFSGHVRANQENLVINADTMTVHYSGGKDSAKNPAGVPVEGLQQKIAKITAQGNVEIVQGDWVATGNAMDFNADKRIVTLAGDARAWQNQNMVSGEKIILYLNEGRSVVEKSGAEGERVKAFIYPGSGKTDNAGQSPQGR